MFAVVLVLAACSDADNNEPKDVQEKDNHIEQKSNDKKPEAENQDTEDDLDADEDQETSIEKKESTDADAIDKSDEAGNEDEQADDQVKADNEEADGEEKLTNLDIVELGYAIFEAQVEEDYDYLESVLSKGSSLNKDNNTIQFDNVTYPHEYEFITKNDLLNLSERYINPDGDNDESVIVGYEVTDFATESSYIIDSQYIKEDGKWKLNDMDINK